MEDKKKEFDQIAYQNDFIRNNYDRINLTVPKGEKQLIEAHAKAHGESTNAFIQRAIREAMQRENEEA